MTNKVDPNQTAPGQSDLGMHYLLTNYILTDSFIVLCWTSPFVILGASILFCRFSIFDGKPAIVGMHGPHSVFDIDHCTVIQCDAEGVSLVDQ